MYCKNCGKQLSNDLYYCPEYGTESKLSEEVILRNRGKSFFFILACTVIIGNTTWIRSFSTTKNSYKDESTNITIIEAIPESHTRVMREESPSLIGTWKCEAGEVTFIEKGNIMMGKDGVALGGGQLKYEVVDDSTLYLSGGDMPVGINMEHKRDGDLLGLELNGETITFYKER